MKLKDLNNDYFHNKSHISTEDELAYLKNKLKTYKKESYIQEINMYGLYDKYRNLYIHNNPNSDLSDFKNSTEHQQYQKDQISILIKNDKLQKLIKYINQKIMYLSNKDVFDEQKTLYQKLKLPAQIPNPTYIQIDATTKIPNPYYSKDAIQKFIGLPWDYPWWVPNSITQYTELNKFLKSKKVPGFTKVYASKNSSATKCIMIANNDKFIWKINVSNLGTGTEIMHSSVRFNGIRYSTKTLLNMFKANEPISI
jgi:hypothetical protein